MKVTEAITLLESGKQITMTTWGGNHYRVDGKPVRFTDGLRDYLRKNNYRFIMDSPLTGHYEKVK